MEPHSTWRSRQEMPLQELPGEAMLLHLDSGDYFCLEGAGLFVWRALDGTRTLHEVAQAVHREFAVSEEQALQDVLRFAAELHAADLLA